MLEAGLAGQARERPVLRGDRLLLGQPAHARRMPEAALVEGEGVGGEMVRAPREHIPHGAGPRVQVERGQSVDEVHADIVEAGLARGPECGAGLGGRVPPVEPGQDAVVEALHAEADPGHPRAPVAGETGRRHVVGIALDGHLRPGLEPEARADAVEHGGHLLRVEQRRGAATEEQRVERDVAGPRRRAGQVALAQERGQEAIEPARGVGRGVEGAVAAPLRAERQVHVDPEPGGAGSERRYGRYLPSRCQRSQCPSPFHDQ